MKKISNLRKLRNDIILAASVITVAVLVFFIIRLTASVGGYAEVKKDGETVGKYPLNVNREVEIGDENSYNLLVIEDGHAYIKEASCPDKLCVHQGRIQKNGETLVCLPNKTVVTIRSEEERETDF